MTPESHEQTLDVKLDDTLAPDAALTTASPPRAGGEPDRGAVIGRYVVLTKLGAGAMGVVLAAYDPELDRKVALKLLKRGDGDAGRLQREAQSLAKLSHANVVAVHDVGIHEGRVFVAMEFVAGQTLSTWMKTRRPWPEVVECFAAAGRGLAAAHEAGLVHRDFKPDNVMLGDDGRVRVMDFGLARVGDGEARPVALEFDVPIMLTPSLGGERLTQTGAIMGTPAYMAPEQFAGNEITARSDQFGYCVALYEALYGKRPFGGETMAALAFAVTQGRIHDPPRAAGVPNWLRAVLRRGLAADPQQRFPDMHTLLLALGTGGARRRRRLVAAGFGVLVLAAASAIGWRQWDESQRIAECMAAGAAIDEIWNDDARAKLSAGLLSTEVAYAQTTAEKVMPWLDGQAEALRVAQTDACLDTRVHAVWSEELLDRATWCLDERRMELEAVLAEISRADAASIQKAVPAVSRLTQVDPCRDPQRLLQSPAPPSEREGVRALRAKASQVAALGAAGKNPESLELARELLEQAEAVGWPTTTALARARLGTALIRTGDYEGAASSLEAGYYEAAKVGANELVADLAINLVAVTGDKLGRREDGLRWYRLADVALTLLAEPEHSLRRTDALSSLVVVHRANAEYDDAKRIGQQVLEIRERALGPEHPEVAAALNSLGLTYQQTREWEQANVVLERALAIREKTLGPDHPTLASALDNLGMVASISGDREHAKALHLRGLAIRERSLGPEHVEVGVSLNNLSNLYIGTDEYEQARPLLERALLIWAKSIGPDHPWIAAALDNLGLVHSQAQRWDEAVRYHAQALAMREKTLGAEHPDLATSLNNLASAHQSRDELALAGPLYARALLIFEHVYGSDDVTLSIPLKGIAEVALQDGRFAEALAAAERSLALRIATQAAAEDLAASRFVLAQALWDAPADAGRDRARARTLVQEAGEALRATGGTDALAEVEAWSRAHGL